jgi:hypothetical protein
MGAAQSKYRLWMLATLLNCGNTLPPGTDLVRAFGERVVREQLLDFRFALAAYDIADAYIGSTRLAGGAINVNGAYDPAALNIYLLDGSRIPQDLGRFSCNCRTDSGLNMIVCDTDYLDAIANAYDFSGNAARAVSDPAIVSALRRASLHRSAGVLTWILGHEIGHVHYGALTRRSAFNESAGVGSEREAAGNRDRELQADNFAMRRLPRDFNSSQWLNFYLLWGQVSEALHRPAEGPISFQNNADLHPDIDVRILRMAIVALTQLGFPQTDTVMQYQAQLDRYVANDTFQPGSACALVRALSAAPGRIPADPIEANSISFAGMLGLALPFDGSQPGRLAPLWSAVERLTDTNRRLHPRIEWMVPWLFAMAGDGRADVAARDTFVRVALETSRIASGQFEIGYVPAYVRLARIYLKSRAAGAPPHALAAIFGDRSPGEIITYFVRLASETAARERQGYVVVQRAIMMEAIGLFSENLGEPGAREALLLALGYAAADADHVPPTAYQIPYSVQTDTLSERVPSAFRRALEAEAASIIAALPPSALEGEERLRLHALAERHGARLIAQATQARAANR